MCYFASRFLKCLSESLGVRYCSKGLKTKQKKASTTLLAEGDTTKDK